jgi:lambda family phage tail tape measure protein
MANTARLGVVLALETGDFVMGLESAKKSLIGFTNDLAAKVPMVAAIGAAAFVGMAKHAMDFADSIADTADATNNSIASVLKIGNALEMSGGKFDSVGKVLEKFNANVSSAAMGSQSLQDAFKKVGISLKDLGSGDTAKLFERAVDGLAKLGDNATTTNIKLQLLGKGIRGVDMINFNDLIKEGNGAWEKYADAVSVAADLHDKLAAKGTRTTLMFTTAFLPAINTTFDYLNKAGNAFETFMDIASFAFKSVIYAGNLLVSILQTINAAVNLVGLTMDDIGKGQFFTFGQRLKEYDAYIGKIREGDKAFARDLLNPTITKKSPAGGNGGRDTELSSEGKKLAEMLAMAKLISVEYERQVKFAEQKQVNEIAIMAMTKDEARLNQAVQKALDDTSKKIDEITKKREDAVGRGADKKVVAEYDNQIEKVKELGAAYASTTKKVEAQAIAQQRTFAYGWNKAFAQYAEDAQNYGKMGEDSFTSITGNMTSAIDKFVDTGKLSFSDLATSIIKDLIKIQLQYMTMQMFSAGASWLGFGAGAAGAGAAGAGAAGGGAIGAGTVMMAAAGGAIDGPTIVGERGPELFIPSRSGTIIPNNNIGDSMGGQTINYNGTYIANMSAIDTQSAQQFLARNKASVWAANQSASRSIPTSR